MGTSLNNVTHVYGYIIVNRLNYVSSFVTYASSLFHAHLDLLRLLYSYIEIYFDICVPGEINSTDLTETFRNLENTIKKNQSSFTANLFDFKILSLKN